MIDFVIERLELAPHSLYMALVTHQSDTLACVKSVYVLNVVYLKSLIVDCVVSSLSIVIDGGAGSTCSSNDSMHSLHSSSPLV